MPIIYIFFGFLAGLISGITLVDHPQKQESPPSIAAQSDEVEETGDPEEPVTVVRPSYGPARARVRNYEAPDEEIVREGPPVRACRGGCPYRGRQ